jgi:CBS domain containing-hemolysin-like protein
MTLLLFLMMVLSAVALALITSAQLLYLESLRIRTRELPSLKYFKETLQDRIGLSVETGSAAFSIAKHTLIAILGVLTLALIIEVEAFHWSSFIEACAAAWVTMLLSAYAVPQFLYRRTKAHWMLPLAPFFRAVSLAAKPIVFLIGFFQSVVELADEKNGHEEPPTPAENIDAFITVGTEEGIIEEEDRELIQSVVEFGDTLVREVITPRPNIVAISADATLEDLRQLVIHEQYSRIPVYEKNIDEILGFVHVRDMFEVEEDERAKRTVRELMRPIRFVPETKPVNDLMREMQADGTHMVMVVDEYGNTAGLATMEDVVEVILGEIRDEHEPDADVLEDAEGGFIVSGSFDVARLSDLVNFRAGEDIESTTVGGLVSEWLGHVPAPGEIAERDGIRVEVLASDEWRVERVRISRVQVPVNEPAQ